MRFNSPPNWPAAPPGWTPAPDWRPDPTWPPPPPGWQLWVDDTPPSNKKGLIIGLVAAALVVVIGAVLAISIFTKGTPDVTVTKPVKTDEEQIKDVVQKYEAAWNDSNFAGFTPIACEDWQKDDVFNETDFLEAREGADDLDLEVTDVQVKKDKATATVENAGNDPDDIEFTRENGEWKWCDF